MCGCRVMCRAVSEETQSAKGGASPQVICVASDSHLNAQAASKVPLLYSNDLCTAICD